MVRTAALITAATMDRRFAKELLGWGVDLG